MKLRHIYIYIYITEKLWIIAIIFLSPVSYLPQILSNWWESGYIISLNKFWIVLFFFLGAILQKKKKNSKENNIFFSVSVSSLLTKLIYIFLSSLYLSFDPKTNQTKRTYKLMPFSYKFKTKIILLKIYNIICS